MKKMYIYLWLACFGCLGTKTGTENRTDKKYLQSVVRKHVSKVP